VRCSVWQPRLLRSRVAPGGHVVKRLVCVSNRIALPRRVRPRAASPSAYWQRCSVLAVFGLAGTARRPRSRAQELDIQLRDNIQFVTTKLAREQFERYYNGYCNSTLWPLFHYFAVRFATNRKTARPTTRSTHNSPGSSRACCARTIRCGCTTII